MRAKMCFGMWLWAVVLWLGMVGIGAGDVIFLDDFAGDDTQGRFVIEAENYCRRAQGAGADWWQVDGADNAFTEGPSQGQVAPTAKSGARGSYMESLGRHIGSTAPIDGFYDGPFLDYKVRIDIPGTYRLYMRWTGLNNASDSLYAFVVNPDGTLLTGSGPDYFAYHQYRKDWIWDYRGVKNTTEVAFKGFPHSAVWTISEPGDYTIRVAHRESGTALDAIALQTENLPEPGASAVLLQSLSVPENVKLSKAEITAINTLRRAIVEKAEMLEEIEAALEKDLAAQEVFDKMLSSGDYGSLGHAGVMRAKQEISAAIQHQREVKAIVANSIARLQDALRALGFELVPLSLVK